MVNKLIFNFAAPTPFVFMKRFLKAAQADKQVCCFTWNLLNIQMALGLTNVMTCIQFLMCWMRHHAPFCSNCKLFINGDFIKLMLFWVCFHGSAWGFGILYCWIMLGWVWSIEMESIYVGNLCYIHSTTYLAKDASLDKTASEACTI